MTALCLSMIEQQLKASAAHVGATGEGWTIELPLHIKNGCNNREHHMDRHRRVEKERKATATALWHRELLLKQGKPKLPVVVTLTRIASRKLDAHDNLPSGFKGVVDEIAAWLGVKDNDPRITWRYGQEKPPKGSRTFGVTLQGIKRVPVYACRIQIEGASE